MSDLQIFLILSGIVLTTLAAGYGCLALKRKPIKRSAAQESGK